VVIHINQVFAPILFLTSEYSDLRLDLSTLGHKQHRALFLPPICYPKLQTYNFQEPIILRNNAQSRRRACSQHFQNNLQDSVLTILHRPTSTFLCFISIAR
jgi:hypothetical protein